MKTKTKILPSTNSLSQQEKDTLFGALDNHQTPIRFWVFITGMSMLPNVDIKRIALKLAIENVGLDPKVLFFPCTFSKN